MKKEEGAKEEDEARLEEAEEEGDCLLTRLAWNVIDATTLATSNMNAPPGGNNQIMQNYKRRRCC